MMKSFEHWLNNQNQEPSPLPEGIIDNGDGYYLARCFCCGEWSELYTNIENIPETGYKHFCGRSPYCCP
jgi:hypothetical protein